MSGRRASSFTARARSIAPDFPRTKKWSQATFSCTTPSPSPWAATITVSLAAVLGSHVNSTKERSPSAISCTPAATLNPNRSMPWARRYSMASGLKPEAHTVARAGSTPARGTYSRLSLMPAKACPAESSLSSRRWPTMEPRTATRASAPNRASKGARAAWACAGVRVSRANRSAISAEASRTASGRPQSITARRAATGSRSAANTCW